MGRGKKKGDKNKEEEPSLSSLTLSDSQPSSSVQASVSGQPSATRSSESQPEPPQPPQPVQASVSSSAPESKDDDDIGLGLSGGKKRQRKKKGPKPDAETEKPSVPAPETSKPTSQQEQGVSVIAAPGRGYGRGRGGPDQGPLGFPAQQAQPYGVPPQTQRPGFPPRAQAPGFPPRAQAPGFPPRAQSSGSSTQQAQPPGFPTQQVQPPGFPPTRLPWGQPSRQPAPQPQPAYPAQQQAGYPAQQRPSYPAQQQPGYAPQQQPGHPAQQQPSHAAQKPSGQMPQQTGTAPTMQQPQRATPSTSSTQLQRTTPESSQICLFKIPNKIPGGKVPAMPTKVLTNYLQMRIKDLKIPRYDVSFKPDKPKKLIPKAFIAAKEKHFPKHLIAFDQMKNCYALKPLPGVPVSERFATNVEVVDPNGKKVAFEVSFKATGTVDLGTITSYMANGTSLSPPTEAIQCVDVILRQGTLEAYVKAGRQFFKRPRDPINLGDGLEIWTGLFQSAIFTSRPFINIDVAHKGFPRQQPLVNAIINDFRLDPSKPIDTQRGRGVENFKHFIKGLRVIARVGGDSSAQAQKREFICNGLVDPPNRLKFTMTDQAGRQTQTTVAEYFQREKRCRLQYPNLNCMWVGPRDKNIYYPIELLEVSYGQALNKQLNEMQLSTMVREAATPPSDRKRKIEEVIRDMNYSRNPYFKEFGLEINNEFFEVEAKILKPPNLEVGNRQSIMPRKGVWQSNQVYKPEALKSWGFIAIETDPRSVNFESIKKMLMDVGYGMGMAVAEPMMTHFNVSMRDLDKILFSAVEKGVNFLFVVVSGRGHDYYHRVKQKAEREVGILTQCIKENTAQRRMNMQTVKNILLKVNSKLMGINQLLDSRCQPNCLRSGGVMVVGADVTHPSPDQTSVPSIAAVTASIDSRCFQYHITLSIQTPKKEMIVEFEDMMVEHLHTYRKYNNNALPKKIFVFRDGVSEGQFAQVMNSELQAVHNAYRRHTGNQVRPEVLFLLVQKRHHTRFFSGANNPQNVEPGTVVDKHIVHARELDFYLVSHQAIKGTARPTRYHAVCNDGGIPDDEVEQLTYYLCHLYSRCTRAVSYPTPTYYAHLACLRARSLTYGEKFDNQDLERRPRRLRVLDKMLEFSKMFFV